MERKDKSKLMYAVPKDRLPGERSTFAYFNSLDPNAVDTVKKEIQKEKQRRLDVQAELNLIIGQPGRARGFYHDK